MKQFTVVAINMFRLSKFLNGYLTI